MSEHTVDLTNTAVNRVELIDHRPDAPVPGRYFVGYDVSDVLLSFQDDGKTLKVMLR